MEKKSEQNIMRMAGRYLKMDNARKHDMETIESHMNQILKLFSEEIMWDRLHVPDKESPINQLYKIVQNVKWIADKSNRRSDEAADE